MESHSMSPGVDPVPSPSPTYPWRPTSSFLDPLGMPLINPSYPSEPERPCPVDTSSPGGSREDTGSENHDHCTLSSSDPSKLPTRQPNEQSTTPRVLYETPDGLRNIQELEKGICRVFLQVLTDPLESTGPCSPQDSNESRKKSSTDGLGPTSPPGGGAGNKHSSLGFGKDLRPGNGNASNTRRSEDEEDNDDDDKHNSNDRDQDNTQQSDQQLFECPFRKRNSEKFDCATHKSCVHQFRDLTKVKDHVRKCHRRRKDTRGNDPGDGITEEMAEKLTGRKRHDKVNTWVKLWRLLFPDDDIPSPGEFICP
ncbi:hypothetical protein QBC38DRAFT_155421 [Podospora fimiseda]|uniref:C2H2-type domain-containing protein n=1 Tax=Podospora fimiseda TaxID=252190 RepID=A0AAN6YLW6_9PEZI|nr:hypothetical protein QBC38DRAFT_155421 [Podospora fimiseda]